MLAHPVFVLAVLCALIGLSEWLVRHTFCRHFGTALLAIVLTAVVANFGLIPSASANFPLYSGIFTYIAPLSIFFLLLEVNLSNLREAGFPMLLMFGIGAAGTVTGVLLGYVAVGGATAFGPHAAAIAGMFTGTYTGGSANFNAVALHYQVIEEGTLFAGAVAVDNIITALWMLATIALPRLLQRRFPRQQQNGSHTPESPVPGQVQDQETLDPLGLSLLLALGLLSLWLSGWLAAWFEGLGFTLPSILILTTFALLLAQWRPLRRLQGARLLGLVSVYLFLTVIGAYCELAAMAEVGELAVVLLVFTGILITVHGLIVFLAGAILKYDWFLVSVASQANIGGSSSALALARSLNRTDLLLPGILAGALGNGIGTYLGFLVAGML